MKNTALLRRFLKSQFWTIGKFQLFDFDGTLLFECFTLELPYKNNQNSISCIPTGLYKVSSFQSPKFGRNYLVQNVPNRELIEFHIGNKNKDTHGCILIGYGYYLEKELENSFISNSKLAFDKLMKLNVKNFDLKISELC